MRSWLGAGQVLAALTFPLSLVLQAVTHDWYPPAISMSQYGVGTWGWIFSLWATAMGVSPVCIERALAFGSASARRLLLTGLAGTVLMAIVRTDAGGAQQSLSAKVHMFGSILSLGLVPLGMFVLLWRLGSGWRLAGSILFGTVAASLLLLLGAAFGYDTAGLGPPASWAWWQTVAVVGDQIMVAVLAVGAGRWLAVRKVGSRSARA